MWDELTHVSTVSGGSLCVALVFEKTGKKWPTATDYLEKILPQAYATLTTTNLQCKLLTQTFTRPWRLLNGRAHVLAKLLEKHWGVTSNVSEIPLKPRWTINTTCYQTGKNFRFSAKRMGDYTTRYVLKPSFPLADAVAASAGFPVGIGPLKVRANKYVWQTKDGRATVQPLYSSYHLWDGGVYENLGLEPLYKIGADKDKGKQLREDIDFCLVSDASAPLVPEPRPWIPFYRHYKQARRLIDIPSEQVRSVRAREAFHYFTKNKCGGYLRIGESVRQILKNLEFTSAEGPALDMTLPDDEVTRAAQFKTTLRAMSPEEYRLIFRHGYETCSTVLAGTGIADFSVWADARWEMFDPETTKRNTKYCGNA